jgi:hypothetical protein
MPLQFLVSLTVFIVIMANAIAIAIGYLTGLPAEQLHLFLRVTSIILALVIVVRERFLFSRLQATLPLLVFYALYIVSSLRHQIISGFGDIAPDRFWFVVGPCVASAILLAIALDRSKIAAMADHLNGFFMAINAPSLVLILASGVSNIRTSTVRDENMGSSLAWGQLGAFAIAVALGAMLTRKPSLRSAFLAVPSALVGAGLIYLSVSRGAFLAAAIVIIATIFANTSHFHGKARKVLGWFKLFLVAMTLVGGSYFLGSDNAQRIFGTVERVESGGEARSEIWASTIALGTDNLLGYGVASPFASHPHNLFLEGLMNAGVPGFLLALGAFGLPFFIAFAHIRRRGANWVDLLFLAVFQVSLVSSSLYLNVAVWFLAALVLSLRGTSAKGSKPARLRTYDHSSAIQA